MNFYEGCMALYEKTIFTVRDIESYYNFNREKKVKNANSKIRVGFMCQYIPGWGKVEPVYRLMQQREEFEPIILCVPMGVHNQVLDNPDDLSNDTYEYYVEHGYEAVNTLIGRNEWLDLRSLKLDYIFFVRPYNAYMPKQYSTHRISRYTKICVLLYAYTLLEHTYRDTLNKDFFCNVHLFFAENKFSMHKNIAQFKYKHKKGIQNSVCFGMAGIEDIVNAKGLATASWNFSTNKFRVMWTPRWTTDAEMGGSNFFKYKDELLEYAGEHPDMDFLFRPHPLMFENFIRTGEMPKEDVDVYKTRVMSIPNVSFDSEKEYKATIWESSVLVSDISSFMAEYFVTGKPIVYCVCQTPVELAEGAKTMMDGCYVVNNSEELFAILDKLAAGDDPLATKRSLLKKEMFGDEIGSISTKIVDELAKRVGR